MWPDVWCGDLQLFQKYGHTWHRMSLLRPGVIKQHKPNPTLGVITTILHGTVSGIGTFFRIVRMAQTRQDVRVQNSLYDAEIRACVSRRVKYVMDSRTVMMERMSQKTATSVSSCSLTRAVFLHCCTDCSSGQAYSNSIGWATWAIWAAVNYTSDIILSWLMVHQGWLSDYVNPYIPTQTPEED